MDEQLQNFKNQRSSIDPFLLDKWEVGPDQLEVMSTSMKKTKIN